MTAAERKFDFGIIIPVLADKDALMETLSALRLLPESDRRRTVCVIAVNSNEKSSPSEIAENKDLLSLAAGESPLCDTGCAESIWLALAVKAKDGVGMARKKAIEAAEPLLAADGIIFSLDADTVVENNYISAVAEAFAANRDWVAASIRFHHRVPSGSPAGMQEAINKYEEYLRSYASGLQKAGSPYAYTVMGSAMAWRKKSGIKAGGMRVRAGGEDFYFLQALRKIGTVGSIEKTVVHPLARCSGRVPFGTGPRLTEILEGTFSATTYPDNVFEILQKLLTAVKTLPPEEYSVELLKITPEINLWLEKADFPTVWQKILKNTPADTEARRKAFHTWFDAFKTLKFIHFLMEILYQA